MWNWWVSRLKLKLVGFKALIETGGVRSIEIFMSRTRLIGVGLVSITNEVESRCFVAKNVRSGVRIGASIGDSVGGYFPD